MLFAGGGLEVPQFLGSAATFTLGGFGGHGGRPLRTGDVLHGAALTQGAAIPAAERPDFGGQSLIVVVDAERTMTAIAFLGRWPAWTFPSLLCTKRHLAIGGGLLSRVTAPR